MDGESRTREELLGLIARMGARIAALEGLALKHEATEQALRRSEARYRSLVKQSSDGVYLFDPNTAGIVEVNDQFLRMLGYREEEIVGLSIYDVLAEGKDAIESNVRRILQQGVHLLGPRRYRRKDGSVIDVETSSTLIRYGEAAVVMVNIRNMAERKQVEGELQAQAAALRDQAELLDVAEDAITVLDMEYGICFWNHGAEERYGWTKEEALGQVIHRLLRTSFPTTLEDIRAELVSKGRWEGELTQTKRSGERIVVRSRWTLRRDRMGKPLAIMEINNDITRQKQAEEALQNSKTELELRVAERTAELQSANERLTVELNRRKQIEKMLQKGAERYKNLFENSPLGIYRINPEGRILMANPALIRMLGYSPYGTPRGEGRTRDFEPSYLRKKIRQKLEREGRVRGFEARWKRPDKSVIYVRENAKAIRDNDGAIMYYEGTVEDMTEQKKAQEKISSYQKQLRSLASDLSLAEERERRRIATMLHDHIGQLLALSKIKLGALLESASSTDFVDDLRGIREHIEQAIQYARSLTFELSPPILYDLGLDAAIEWLTEQIEEQHGILCKFESDDKPKPVSDEMRVFLFTAVRELLVNVAKHAGAEIAKVTIRRVNDTITIHVADNGAGFNAARKQFYLEDNKGFGLFSIRERLRHLSGQMEVRSSRGRGTRIVLIAPLVNHRHKVREEA